MRWVFLVLVLRIEICVAAVMGGMVLPWKTMEASSNDISLTTPPTVDVCVVGEPLITVNSVSESTD